MVGIDWLGAAPRTGEIYADFAFPYIPYLIFSQMVLQTRQLGRFAWTKAQNDAVWSKEVPFGVRVFIKLRLGIRNPKHLFLPQIPISKEINSSNNF